MVLHPHQKRKVQKDAEELTSDDENSSKRKITGKGDGKTCHNSGGGGHFARRRHRLGKSVTIGFQVRRQSAPVALTPRYAREGTPLLVTLVVP